MDPVLRPPISIYYVMLQTCKYIYVHLSFSICRKEILKAGREDIPRFKEKALADLLGACFITRYNNRIVRVDDIDFDSNPMSTFERKGEKVSIET